MSDGGDGPFAPIREAGRMRAAYQRLVQDQSQCWSTIPQQRAALVRPYYRLSVLAAVVWVAAGESPAPELFNSIRHAKLVSTNG